ncbi:LysR family transcriptional regulator [Enterovibrio coralii]|uniref:LysR family transcriptional regulator n=1 Tax=Enterovibrio coralii TaxID=294935 RepID=A0A135I806_9GAMM|nr:LysR family transcriptional regulator [Enterovibrio coralii]KXF81591.1 LysR family transcriptional regulator [Enterovibrio coralii]
MKAQKIDWSDIPFVLAVCDTGSLSGAARTLQVNHSTVFRRIEAVEEKLAVRLFQRLSRGYVMTSAGEYFYEKAKTLRNDLNEIESQLCGEDLRLEGVLTVTTTDSVLYWLTPLMRQFQTQHPDVELRLVSEVRSFDLMQHDADIALRPTSNPPEHFVGRALLPISYAVYAHRAYYSSLKENDAKERWICLTDDLYQSPMSKITKNAMPQNAQITVANSMMGVFELVRAGLGIAALPCYLGEQNDELVRITAPDTRYDGQLWLLAHPNLRRSARVHAFFEFVSTHIHEHIAVLTQKNAP